MERMDKGNMVVVSEVSDAMCKGASADITEQFAHWYLSMNWCFAQFLLIKLLMHKKAKKAVCIIASYNYLSRS